MKKTDEMKREIEQKRQEVDKLQREEQVDAALKAAEELNKMVNEYNIAKALEVSDFEKFANGAKSNAAPESKDKAVLRNRAFNKLVFQNVLHKPLTEAEREAYYNVSGSPGQPGQIAAIPSKGGYLVPEESMARLQEFEKAYVSLKDYVTVIETGTTSGKWATLPDQLLEFKSFEELTDIAEDDIEFGQVKYEIEDKGLIIPISNQLIDDADVNIIEVVGRQLAKGAIRAENTSILTPLNQTLTTAATVSSYKTLNQALFRDLDNNYYNNSRIYTNQDGFLYLSNLEDGNKRPLFTPDVSEPDTYRFRGRPIVVIPNATLPNTDDGYAPFFVGDMSAYITFFERKGMELSLSTEYLWRKYGTALRAVIRYGVTVVDENSMIALKVKV